MTSNAIFDNITDVSLLKLIFYWHNGVSSHPTIAKGYQVSNYFDGFTLREIRDTPTLRQNGSFTVMIWIKPTQGNWIWAAVFGKGSLDLRKFGLWLHFGCCVAFQIYPGTWLQAAVPPINSWTHITGVFDMYSSHFYINGTRVTLSNNYYTPYTDTEPLTIGDAKNYPGGLPRFSITSYKYDACGTAREIVINFNTTFPQIQRILTYSR